MGYKSIVCGVTGSEASARAAEGAALLAKEHQADLTFVYAVDRSFLKGITVQLTAEFAVKSLEHLGGHILDNAEEIAREQGVSAKKVLRRGKVLEVLQQVTAEEKADLLVLGSENRSFFEKVILGGEVLDHVGELKNRTGVEVRIIK